MAYFSNGSEGMSFDVECLECFYGKDACPIAGVQMGYNYEACNNKVATNILNELIKNDGTCSMKKLIEQKEPHKKYDGEHKNLFEDGV